jgi:hypothetical protein
MTFFAEGRLSDSPYVECVWRGAAEVDHTLMCPADGRLNLCFTRLNGETQVTMEGALSQAVPDTHVGGVEWLVIKFRLGVFFPAVPARRFLNSSTPLPDASGQRFWFHGASWQLPTFENADTFVNWLMRDNAVQVNPIISGALHDQPPDVSARTLRHHFLQTTGLTQSHIRQIERARDAMTLLQGGMPILDVVSHLAYADQPHLTRSMKRFMGYTPTQVMGWRLPV